MDPIVVEVCLPFHGVGNSDELYRPFGRFELHGRQVRLFVSRYEAHVSFRGANESGHVGMASDCSRGPRCVVLYWED